MKFSARLFAMSALAAVLALPSAAPAFAAQPYPLEYWSVRDAMSNVEISPDGKYVAFMKISSLKGNPSIEVYEVNNLSKEPYRVGAKSMEITGFSWISNEEMTVSFRRQVRKKIRGFNQGTFKGKLALFSIDTKEFKELNSDSNDKLTFTNLANILAEEPDKILVQVGDFARDKAFVAPSYYKLDLKTGGKQLVLRGSSQYGRVLFDPQGNPRFTSEDAGDEFIYYYRPVGGSGWKEYYRQSEDSFENFSYAGLVDGNPDQIYVRANNGQDKQALWKYNLSSKSFGQKVYSNNDVDIWGTFRHTNDWSQPGKVTGVSYYKDKFYRNYFDKTEEAMMRQLERSIPNAGLVSVTSRSRDGNTMIVRNTADKDPGTFYLYRNGKLSKLGSVNGLIKADGLAKVEYVTYASSDGKKIPGFVTRPNGAGPHPLVVMPHGGPFISETVIYDEWAQLLANNGYMVLQPQYRGSTNYGQEFYQSAFIDGGEGGKLMQDDKDWGAKYLISKGDVDKDRVAMFGWSYGGYAALIAAARSPNIYQCVIAGAAVADNNQQLNYYRTRLSGASEVEQAGFWSGSISPIDEVSKVNVPMLVVHGSADQRVPPKHADKYVKALKSEGKNFKYVELKNADHFSNTLTYDHKNKLYTNMINYLKNDCGPGGL